MMTMPRKSFLAAALFCACTPALADQVQIPNGTPPPAETLGHVFMSLCKPQLPPLMESDFELFKDLFSFTPRDGDADHTIASPDDQLQVTFSSSFTRGTVCEMTVASALSGDGFAIYEGLEAHLIDAFDDALPQAQSIDGGLAWSWAREGVVEVNYTVEFIETAEGHTLRTTASQF